jgi:hypothetical protein
MGFLIFIWNTLMRIIGLLGFILMEIMIFGLVYYAILDSYPVVANGSTDPTGTVITPNVIRLAWPNIMSLNFTITKHLLIHSRLM